MRKNRKKRKNRKVSLKRQLSIIIGAGIAISNTLLVLLLSYNVLVSMAGFMIEVDGKMVEYHFTDGLEKKLLIVGIAIGIVTTIIGVLATSYFVNMQMSPMRKLAEHMAKIDRENLNEHIYVEAPMEEAKILIESFNNMTKRVSEAFENQKNLTSYIAHELRTPLAVIQTKLDVYKKMPDNEKNPDGLVDMMDSQVSKLTLLINQILKFSSIQRIELTELVPIYILIEEVFDDLEDKALEKNVELNLVNGTTMDENDLMKVEVKGNHELLYQGFYNLIENAIKYNVDNGIVKVVIEVDKKINVKIQDTGCGIPEDEKEKIFEPFYRSLDKKTLKKQGNGIGLSLAKKIINHHKGEIYLVEACEFSTCFQVQLDRFERNSKGIRNETFSY